MAELFLSYTREDKPAAEAIALQLQRLGVDVWWDHDLFGGEDFRSRILEIIKRSSSTIVIWSRRSVNSQWVVGEASAAKEMGKLLPVNLDRSDPPLDFRGSHTIDLSEWVPGDNLPEVFLRDLSQKLGREVVYEGVQNRAGTLARATRKITNLWFLDLESVVFLLTAHAMASMLLTLTFLKSTGDALWRPSVADGVSGAPETIFFVGFSFVIGGMLALLILRPVLQHSRVAAAAALIGYGALQSVLALFLTDFLMRQMKDNILLIVGPATLAMLLLMTLGDRAARG
jgi:hypothetical protein